MNRDGLLKDVGVEECRSVDDGHYEGKTTAALHDGGSGNGRPWLSDQQWHRQRLCLASSGSYWALILGSIVLVMVGTTTMIALKGAHQSSHDTPQGCDIYASSLCDLDSDDDSYLPFTFYDCRGQKMDGPRLLMLDDLAKSNALARDVFGRRWGRAKYADGSLAYNYSFTLGDDDDDDDNGTGDRGLVHVKIHTGFTFDLNHTDAVLLFSARAGADAFGLQVLPVDLSDVDVSMNINSTWPDNIVAYMKSNADIAAFTANVVEQYNQEKENENHDSIDE